MTRVETKPEPSSTNYPRLEEVNISKVKAARWNPRTATRKGLKLLEKSYEEFGNLQPIIINRRTDTLIAGHQRLKILRRKKEKTTQAWVVDLPVTDEKVASLALNNHAGDFDLQMLSEVLSDLQAMKDNLDHTLFSEEEIDRIIHSTLPQTLDTYDDEDNSIDNNEKNEESQHATQKSASEVFSYSLYFENPTDKLKILAFVKQMERKRPDVKLNGELLLIAFDGDDT